MRTWNGMTKVLIPLLIFEPSLRKWIPSNRTKCGYCLAWLLTCVFLWIFLSVYVLLNYNSSQISNATDHVVPTLFPRNELQERQFQQIRNKDFWNRLVSFRRLKIDEVCNRSGGSLNYPRQFSDADLGHPILKRHYEVIYNSTLLSNVVKIPQWKVMWCIIPKVLSTSLSHLFLSRLYVPVTPEYQIKPQVLLKKTQGSMEYKDFRVLADDYLKFFVTRHPFVRLLSAYINKLENRFRSEDGLYFYNLYGLKIIAFNRGVNISSGIYFPEPTFPEFVNYIVNCNATDLDEHWLPIYLQCRVCQIRYDVILKMENIEFEIGALSTNLQVEKLEERNKNGFKTDSLLLKYFSGISPPKLRQLYYLYKPDFEMFGYEVPKFLKPLLE